ncbi:MAG: RsmE family RNA methyltransferase [Ilumatobacteraceae bacterium]
MNPLLRNANAHVFVKSLSAPSLAFEDEHHLDRVLRIDEADAITVCDGSGKWATATWSRKRGTTLTSAIFEAPRPVVLSVGYAIPKGDRADSIVQKLTEIGMDRLLMFETSRSVVHWDADKRTKQLERLNRIAREASMQSRRLYLPAIQFTTFDRVIEMNGVALAEPGGKDGLTTATSTLLVGPEGGFDTEELDYAVPKVSLSLNILRVETAAIVAGAALVACHS